MRSSSFYFTVLRDGQPSQVAFEHLTEAERAEAIKERSESFILHLLNTLADQLSEANKQLDNLNV